MTSAFFLGAFVTAHFLMPCSSIHWIHSRSPFTMGRPLSTAQQGSHLEHLSKLEEPIWVHGNVKKAVQNLGPRRSTLGMHHMHGASTAATLGQDEAYSEGDDLFTGVHSHMPFLPLVDDWRGGEKTHMHISGRGPPSHRENLSRNAWSRSGHRNFDRSMLWPPEMCSSKNSLSMGAPFLKPCAAPRLSTITSTGKSCTGRYAAANVSRACILFCHHYISSFCFC